MKVKVKKVVGRNYSRNLRVYFTVTIKGELRRYFFRGQRGIYSREASISVQLLSNKSRFSVKA